MIAAIETAIQARLRAAGTAGALGYRYATLESYPANWDVYFREKTPRAPGAWVVFAGFHGGAAVGFGGLRAEAHFGLVVMAENARNETAQRHGGATAAEPGSYQLATDAIALFQGSDLDGLLAGSIEIRSCSIVRTHEIAKERKISMLALELAVPLAFQGATVEASGAPQSGLGLGLGDFATFHADWDVPPLAAQAPLPDDAHADAVDHLELETHA